MVYINEVIWKDKSQIIIIYPYSRVQTNIHDKTRIGKEPGGE